MRLMPNRLTTSSARRRAASAAALLTGASARPGIALQLQPREPPRLRPALQRDDPVRHAGVDQRLRADDAAGAAGAGDDDQRIRVGHQIGEAMHQLGAGAAHRARHMKAVELLDRTAVEHRQLRPLAPDPVEFVGGDMRRVPVDLDDLGKGLARHVGARKQRMPCSLPGRHAARDDMHGGIAEPASRRAALSATPSPSSISTTRHARRGTRRPTSSSSRLYGRLTASSGCPAPC